MSAMGARQHPQQAMAARSVRAGSTPERAADVLEQQQQVQRIGG
jgi:hypothetical protein